MNVYIVPVAEKGFVGIDDERNKVRWYIQDEGGRIFVRGSFATLDEARDYAKKNGWNLPNEP